MHETRNASVEFFYPAITTTLDFIQSVHNSLDDEYIVAVISLIYRGIFTILLQIQ